MNKILLLLWKNLLFRRRHYIVTTCEVILPTLMAIIIALMLYNAPPKKLLIAATGGGMVNGNTIFSVVTEQQSLDRAAHRLSTRDYDNSGSPKPSTPVVAFTPNTSNTNRIMDKTKEYIGERAKFELKGFPSEKDAEEYLAQSVVRKSNETSEKITAVIVFLSKWSNVPPPGIVAYKIRLVDTNLLLRETGLLFPLDQRPGPSEGNLRNYEEAGFTGLQIAIDKALIWILTKQEFSQKINTQAFPYPPYKALSIYDSFIGFILPRFLVIGFIFIVPSVIRNVVSEKETGIKELMKMMGLPNWMHWLAWLLNSLLLLIISISIVILFIFVPLNPVNGAVIEYGNFTIWWLVLFLFVIAVTAFYFFLSTFFQRPALATTFGLVIYLATYFGIIEPMEKQYLLLSLPQKLASSLVPTVALHWAIKVMYGFEGKSVGAGWNNLFDTLISTDQLCVGYLCLMLIFDTVLFMMLTIYFENVLPSEYGLRRPFYYIFQCSKSRNRNEEPEASPSSSRPQLKESDGFEAEPDDLPAGIVIKDLRKEFGRNKVAVDMAGTLKMYDGQITALLGHNGAGKTTTLSILTGLFAPTSGTATVNGFDIKDEMDKVRENLGLCPQHNMLFAKLTVEEHFLFFGMLKGLDCAEAKAETEALLWKLHLNEKRSSVSEKLSGGQKRKVCLGMALIGGTKVVILDEPSSGMDPETRRAIWDLLLAMRGERTIVLTTHFMEEADVLGDRIAIMAEGKVKCCGTPNFLKKFYGVGYTLKITVADPSVVPDVLEVIQSAIPTASRKKTQSGNAAELDVTIPTEDNPNAKFPDLFSTLGGVSEGLGIQTIGVSLATMDDIFIKVGEQSGIEEVEVLEEAEATMESDGYMVDLDSHERLTGLTLALQQFYGIFFKHMMSTLKKPKVLISQFLIPLALLILCIYISNNMLAPDKPAPPLKMDLNMYNNPVTYFNATSQKLATAYKSAVGKSAVSVDDVPNALIEMGKRDIGAYREHAIVAGELNNRVSGPDAVTVTTPNNVTVTTPNSITGTTPNSVTVTTPNSVTVTTPDSVTALYSTIPYHASPLSVNLMSNAILRTMKGSDYILEVTTHPLDSGLQAVREGGKNDGVNQFVLPLLFGVLLSIGLALWAASFIVSPVEERLCKAKQIQMMTGVQPVVYWLATLLGDFCLMFILICLMLACFPIFQTYKVYTAYNGAGVVLLILVLYGFAAIVFSYFCSTFVGTVPGGFSLVAIVHVVTGIIFAVPMFMVEFLGFELLFFRIICCFFPTFNFSLAIMRFISAAIRNSRCVIVPEDTLNLICLPNVDVRADQRQCCPNCRNFVNPRGPSCFEPEAYLTWFSYMEFYSLGIVKKPGIGQDLLALTMIGVFYTALLLIIEHGLIRRLLSLMFKSDPVPFENSLFDEDVFLEKQRVMDLVNTGRTGEDALVVDNLCKSYGSFAAVTGLTFGVHYGECFGLLGVNGAGKTTTFRMLTGDEFRSFGNAYSNGLDLDSDRSDFLRQIGYCPQFDGIIGVLTGKQMVDLFARLRGVRPSRVLFETHKWLSRLGLADSSNVQCQKYSGGMKRRLCAAIALVGDSRIVLFDEPTSGVDPIARRQFWKVIDSVRSTGQAVILTSHSMEECEVLCSRLGIMVNGQFQCFGGVQHLKAKYGQGYRLVITLSENFQEEKVDKLCVQIGTTVGLCFVRERHQRMLEVQVVEPLGWGEIFRRMENVKQASKKLIDDYSITETSLEEVFLGFARLQYPERSVEVSGCKKCMTCQC